MSVATLGRFALSPQQRHLWELGGDRPPFRAAAVIRLEGPLDREELAAAVHRLGLRHEILRTGFERSAGMTLPLQVVGEEPPRLEVAPPRPAGAGELAGTLLEAALAEPSDLSEPPAARFELVPLSPADHLLVVSMPALAGDEESLRLLLGETVRLYAGEAPREEPLQFADIAGWLEELLDSEEAAEGLEHWRERGRGLAAARSLPPFASGDEGGWFDPAELALPEDAAAARAVERAGESLGRAPESLLLAAWILQLTRIAGGDPLLFGLAADGRDYDALVDAPGPLARVLPLALEPDPGEPFAAFAARVEAACGEARQWQQCFSWSHWRPSEAEGGERPYLPLVFAASRRVPPAEAGGVRFSLLRSRAISEPSLLRLSWEETPEGEARWSWRHDRSRLGRDAVERLAAGLRALLRRAVASPGEPLASLHGIDAGERRELVAGFNRPLPTEPPASGRSGTGIAERFFAVARERPTVPAVVSEDGSVSYGELAARAAAWAERLRAAGAGPERVVAIHLDASPRAVAALFGALGTGGAFLPLATDLPRTRLAELLADSGAAVVVTETPEAVPARDGLLVLPAEDPEPAHGEPGDPAPAAVRPALPGSLAYLVYTSGSTGRPKAVAVGQDRLLTYVDALRARLDARPETSFVMLSGLATDLGYTSLFGALLGGGTLHLAGPRLAIDPPALARHLERHGGADVLKVTPSHLASLLDGPWAASLLPRHRLVLGGEAASRALLTRLEGSLAPERIVNHYGPTETTVGVLCGGERLPSGGLALGRPLAGRTVYVVGRDLAPRPTWVAGELAIGGAGVARGYLGRPARTAGAFVPDPFAAAPGMRLYRTGDLARHLPGARLEFLGRADDQVKVRGFRVEPGEVEAHLARLAGVRRAALLVARRGDERGAELVAFVVPHDSQVDAEALGPALEEALPPWMVPARIVLVDEIPLTPQGKLDRRALAEADAAAHREGGTRTAPRNPTETLLAGIWAEVLGLDEVGVEDGFFTLGGDSILAIQVVARANRAGLRLTPHQLFRHQTVVALAAAAGSDRTGPQTLEEEREPVTGRIEPTPIQRWLLASDEDPSHYNQALFFELDRPLEPQVLEAALRRLAERHDALRLRRVRHDGDDRLEYAEPGSAAPGVEVVRPDPAWEPGDGRLAAALAAVRGPFDLERGPLLRAALVAPGAGEGEPPGRLLLCAHHLAVDGVSWQILLEELAVLLGEGADAALGPRTAPFKSWAEALAEERESETTAAEAPFWLDAATGPAASLPIDGEPGTPNLRRDAETLTETLDPATTEALLRRLPRETGTDLGQGLLGAVARCLLDRAGGRTLRIEMEGHGRSDLGRGLDVGRTVGWFTARYPVRLELPAGGDPRADAEAAHRCLETVPRGGIGHGLLRHAPAGTGADPAASARLREAPPPEVSLNYLGRLGAGTSEALGWRHAGEDVGPLIDPDRPRPHLLEVSAGIAEGRLVVTWTYSPRLHRRATVEGFARAAGERLRALAAAVGGRPEDAAEEAGIEEVYPLSPIQQGLLFHSLRAGDRRRGTYFMPVAYLLEGPLDPEALRRAWQTLVDRHPILRTSFLWEGRDEPVQRVHRRVEVPLSIEDWSDLSGEEQTERFERRVAEERRRGCDLSRAPAMRLALFDLGGGRHRLLWSRHHILLDGWSTGHLLGEVVRLYAAELAGASAALPPAVPYRRYLDWLERQDRAEARAYWSRALAGVDEPTPLPEGSAPGGGETAAGATGLSTRTLPPAVSEALERFARRHGLTTSTLVQAAWTLVLAGHSGRDRVVFGATVSGRPSDLEGFESIVGPLINTLPVVAGPPAPGDDLAAWLRGLQLAQAERDRFAYSPLVDIHDWSPLPRDRALFESIVVFENHGLAATAGEGSAAPAGLPLRVVDSESFVRNSYALTLRAAPTRPLLVEILYDEARFTSDRVRALLDEVCDLLGALAAEEAARPTADGVLARLAEQRRRREGDREERFAAASRRALGRVRRKSVGGGGGA